MPFRFVHAADLHLGSPLRGLATKDTAVAALFAQATRTAFTTLVSRTIAAEAAFLVIAGDVFDGDWRDYATGLFFTAELARLSRAGIAVYLLAGNHDAEGEISRHLTLPSGVSRFSTRHVESFALEAHRVMLHGRGFPERGLTENVVPSYPAPRAGWFNIGVLHTSLDGREGHAPYAPCTRRDLIDKQYDYWALGHVHAFEEVTRDPWAVFPGVLQGRHVRESGPKGAVLVEVDDRLRVASVERLIVDAARWGALDIDVTAAASFGDLGAIVEEKIAAAFAGGERRPLALRIALRGETSMHAAIAGDIDRLDAEVRSAAARITDRVFIESVAAATAPARAQTSTASPTSELIALLDAAVADLSLRDSVAEVLRPIAQKLPRDAQMPLLDDVLMEARALLLARLDPEASS